MSLSGRLSGFFLGALGFVLFGFSIALYVSARVYLQRQVDERMNSALAVLAAAAEINADGVEWEPRERLLTLGQDTDPDRLRWRVDDDRGHRIDESPNLTHGSFSLDLTKARGRPRFIDSRGHHWAVARRRLTTPGTDLGEFSTEDASDKSSIDEPMTLFPSLVLTVYAPLEPVQRTLASLGWTLAALSLGIWTIAAVLGRALVRRALRPLTRMVHSARGLDATDPGWTLEPAGTADELDELSRAFNDLLGRLHVAYERQRRFSTDASHQLRTPLTALIGQIDVALRRERDPDEYRRVLCVLHERALYLNQIVEALLFLGRTDDEAGFPEGEPIELRKWIGLYLKERAARGSTELISCRDSQPKASLWVRAHPPLLGQLLDNLLDNAEKYGQSGNPTMVDFRRDGGLVSLSVEDSGPGISAEDLPHLFEPFYRSVEAHRLGKSGVGLGLAIAQRIAQAFDGTISVDSQAGSGARFEVRLPAIEEIPQTTSPSPIAV